MLESITCLIETVKKKCNPVLGNAQTDRLSDRFDHFLRERRGGRQTVAFYRRVADSTENTPSPGGCDVLSLRAEHDQTDFPGG
jgi:hypothetical protein